MGIKRLRKNNRMYCKTALCKSSFIQCVVAIAECEGSLQYVGGKKRKKWILFLSSGKHVL